MTEFRRPSGVHDDPEHSYRDGYQDGALAVLKALHGRLNAADAEKVRLWIEGDLQVWRHDRAAHWRAPVVTLA
jgi:hypothetical protein